MPKDYIRFVIFLKIITRNNTKKPANVHIVPHKSDNKISGSNIQLLLPPNDYLLLEMHFGKILNAWYMLPTDNEL